MMHRCSGSNMMGQCSCGVFHSQSNSFSMLFSMPPTANHHNYKSNYDESHDHMYSFASPSSVDCTLSLGTPSTRLTNNNDYPEKSRRSSNCMSNFCWDILHPKHSSNSSSSNHSSNKSNRGAASNSNSSGSADNLLARRCANCDTTSTPLWRNGPKGPKSLCNACGIRFKKEERRATAAAATNGGSSGGGNGAMVDSQRMLNSSWVHHNSQTQKIPYISSAYANEFRFVEDDDHSDSDTAIPFLSWRLNVTDRPGLVHEFTR